MGWPVVLVLDASGQAQTAAAVAHGLATYRVDVRVAGVVLNKVPLGRRGKESYYYRYYYSTETDQSKRKNHPGDMHQDGAHKTANDHGVLPSP